MSGPAAVDGVEAVRDLVGVPFKLWGRVPAEGLDCMGAGLAGMARLGIAGAIDPWELIQHTQRRDAWNEGTPWQCVCRAPISEAVLLPGDLVTTLSGQDEGTGCYVGGGWVLTSNADCGVHLRRFDVLRARLLEAWRWCPK